MSTSSSGVTESFGPRGHAHSWGRGLPCTKLPSPNLVVLQNLVILCYTMWVHKKLGALLPCRTYSSIKTWLFPWWITTPNMVGPAQTVWP